MRTNDERVRHLEGEIAWDRDSMSTITLPVEPRDVVIGGTLSGADWENWASVFEAIAGNSAGYSMNTERLQQAEMYRAAASRCLDIAEGLARSGGRDEEPF